jgi:aminoglycoside 3-N-acetyltransferase
VALDAGRLAVDLRRLGLRAGHHVLVHSSLSSLGWVDGGAATVMSALLDVVGETGTLVVPTLTGTAELQPGQDLRFDVLADPGWTGVVAETVRTWPGAVRSWHPTHSVAAVGAGAVRLTQGHHDDVTPCGTNSPYARLAADPDGVVLLLGCDHECNTTIHHVEELAGVGYHLQPAPATASIVCGPTTVTRTGFLHRYGTERNFMALDPMLDERGLQATGQVGDAEARLVPVGTFVGLALDLLRAAPAFLVAPDARSRA